MAYSKNVPGAAALSISESLLLCLSDRKILSENDILGVMDQAIAAHLNAPVDDGLTETHNAVAVLIQSIIDGGNSVRRPG